MDSRDWDLLGLARWTALPDMRVEGSAGALCSSLHSAGHQAFLWALAVCPAACLVSFLEELGNCFSGGLF